MLNANRLLSTVAVERFHGELKTNSVTIFSYQCNQKFQAKPITRKQARGQTTEKSLSFACSVNLKPHISALVSDLQARKSTAN